jgi:hypothetical protein
MYRILLIALIVWKLDAVIVSIKTAFLHGDEVINMECPEGMIAKHSKYIYGLVKAARQWYKKFVGILCKIGCK